VPDTRKSGEGNYPKDLPKKEQDEGTRWYPFSLCSGGIILKRQSCFLKQFIQKICKILLHKKEVPLALWSALPTVLLGLQDDSCAFCLSVLCQIDLWLEWTKYSL
jgi:hypothetical protein